MGGGREGGREVDGWGLCPHLPATPVCPPYLSTCVPAPRRRARRLRTLIVMSPCVCEQVTVHTSADVPGAGTDANVFIDMHGTERKSGARQLSGPGNLFEAGNADVFTFKVRQGVRERSLTSSIALSLSQPCGIPLKGEGICQVGGKKGKGPRIR
eukprot:364711-Chlamydomonas_euryale.AAC.5